MLVLSRKELQTIVISDEIEVTVVAIQGGRVKLGISAPRNVPIRRSEIEPSFVLEVAATRPTDTLVELGENNYALL